MILVKPNLECNGIKNGETSYFLKQVLLKQKYTYIVTEDELFFIPHLGLRLFRFSSPNEPSLLQSFSALLLVSSCSLKLYLPFILSILSFASISMTWLEVSYPGSEYANLLC